MPVSGGLPSSCWQLVAGSWWLLETDYARRSRVNGLRQSLH
jgi:hypothetical protein